MAEPMAVGYIIGWVYMLVVVVVVIVYIYENNKER